ncbi:glutamate 5-kinase [Cytobacillus purgationiresistens]|uniref:Glutamate 5-kinase n=1 Tax=Cytobacillus purgationiresistens TaxID=863449 RepID=A0ABU0AG02_9BACI|nr:glutamate 5-kinase [Cytobacillus purgationiresistens]MDQ0269661.1 glutamate 5-kinase [Cytobacillus purgationiresistens]
MGRMRIVVKIGSSSLTNEKAQIDDMKFTDHVDAIAQLRKEGHEVIVVSSGAVAAGFAQLGYSSRPITLKGKQAAAAVGQGLLIQAYMKRFLDYQITPAQILLTRSDFSDRLRYKNAYETLMELLERRILPIINENDTVSVEELTFGDNDMLSALVSGLVHADHLIILTDINGIYNANPKVNPRAKKFDYLECITEEILEAAKGSGSKIGTGGMKSKLNAAKTACSLGVPVFIGKEFGKEKLINIIKGKGDGTYIENERLPVINTRRQWIAFHSKVTGKIYIDKGAEEAILLKGKSLLPAGVNEINGDFQKGDVVEVVSAHKVIGKGEVSCSSEELKKCILINDKPYYLSSNEVIHRNKWVRI